MVVFVLEKFHQYIYGCLLTVQSDRKPLEVIAKKQLHRVPKRFRGVLLRLLVYDVNLVYRCGKQMELADAISPTYHPNMDRSPFETEVEPIHMIQDTPVGASRLQDIRNQT